MERLVERRAPRSISQGRIVDNGGSSNSWWSPQRDIVVVFVKMLRRSFAGIDPPDDPVVANLMTRLGVTREMLASLASAYAALILAVNQRKDALSWWTNSSIRTHPANAVLAAVFMDFMTEEYLQSYGETQHGSEADPNDADRDDFCRSVEALAMGRRSLWSKIRHRAHMVMCAITGKI